METPAAAVDDEAFAEGEAERDIGDLRLEVEALPFVPEPEGGAVVFIDGRTSGAIGFAGGSAN